ncbi:MAG: hypothetical protein ACTHM9_12635 [Gemmatimonadales bacterium]|jgi:hypothetical protein
MARAEQHSLRRSGIEVDRLQREEEPEVPGASGSPDDHSTEAAQTSATKHLGKTSKHGTAGSGER